MKFDKADIIERLGIQAMSPEQQDALVDSVQASMNLRLVNTVAGDLTNEQLEAFSKLSEDNPAGITEWLEQNVPNFETIIDQVGESVIAEVKND